MTTTAPYGSWASPVTVDQLTSASVGLSEVRVDGADLYWLEAHPEQAGRCGVWRAPLAGGEAVEATPPTANVRTRVHEYGGGAYGVRDGVLVYSEMSDGRLYRVDGTGEPRALTSAGDVRFADVRVHPARGLVLAVREDHRGAGECVNTLVAVALDPAARRATSTSARSWSAARTSARPPSSPTTAGWPGSPGTTPPCPGTPPPSTSGS